MSLQLSCHWPTQLNLEQSSAQYDVLIPVILNQLDANCRQCNVLQFLLNFSAVSSICVKFIQIISNCMSDFPRMPLEMRYITMNLVVESNRDYSLIENHIIHFLRGSVRFFFFLVWVLVQVTAYNYTLLFSSEDIRKIVLSFF